MFLVAGSSLSTTLMFRFSSQSLSATLKVDNNSSLTSKQTNEETKAVTGGKVSAHRFLKVFRVLFL